MSIEFTKDELDIILDALDYYYYENRGYTTLSDKIESLTEKIEKYVY